MLKIEKVSFSFLSLSRVFRSDSGMGGTCPQVLRSIGSMAEVLPGMKPTDRKIWLIKYLGRNYPGLTVCKAAWKKARAGKSRYEQVLQ